VINSRKSLKPIKKSKKLVEKCNELPILNVKITSEWEKAFEEIYRGNREVVGYDTFIGRIKVFTKELMEEIKNKNWI